MPMKSNAKHGMCGETISTKWFNPLDINSLGITLIITTKPTQIPHAKINFIFLSY